MSDNIEKNRESTQVDASPAGSESMAESVHGRSDAVANALLKGTEEGSGALFTLIEEVACAGGSPVKGLSAVPTVVYGLYRNIKDKNRFSDAAIDIGKNVAITFLPLPAQATLKLSEASAAASECSEEYLKSFVACYENGIDDHELERLHEQGMVWAMGLPAKGIDAFIEKIKKDPKGLVPSVRLLVPGVELLNLVFHKQPLSDGGSPQTADAGVVPDDGGETMASATDTPKRDDVYDPRYAGQYEAWARQRVGDLVEPTINLKKLAQPIPLGDKAQFKPSFNLFSNKISLGILWQFGGPTPITIVGGVGDIFLHELAKKMDWYRNLVRNISDGLDIMCGNDQVKYRRWSESNLPKYRDYFTQFDEALPVWMNKILNMDPTYVDEERQMASALHELGCKFFGTDSDRSERRDKFFADWASKENHPDEKHRNQFLAGMLKEYKDVVGYDGGDDRSRECGDLWHMFDRYEAHYDAMRMRESILMRDQIFHAVQDGDMALLEKIQSDCSSGEVFSSALQEVLLHSNRQIMQGGEGAESALDLWITCMDTLSRRDFMSNDGIYERLYALLQHVCVVDPLSERQMAALSPVIEKLVDQVLLHSDDPRAVSILSACGGALYRHGHVDQEFAQSVFKQCFEHDSANRLNWASWLVALPDTSNENLRLYFSYLNDHYRDASPDNIRANHDEMLRLLCVGQDLLRHPDLLPDHAEILRYCE